MTEHNFLNDALDGGVVVNIGQINPAMKAAMDRAVRAGKLAEWRGKWFPLAGASFGMGPDKTCSSAPRPPRTSPISAPPTSCHSNLTPHPQGGTIMPFDQQEFQPQAPAITPAHPSLPATESADYRALMKTPDAMLAWLRGKSPHAIVGENFMSNEFCLVATFLRENGYPEATTGASYYRPGGYQTSETGEMPGWLRWGVLRPVRRIIGDHAPFIAGIVLPFVEQSTVSP